MTRISRKSFFFVAIAMVGLMVCSISHPGWAQTQDPRARKVMFYQDSMHPWIKSDQPGKCTICGMNLTPIYEGEKGFGVNSDMVVLSSNSITVLNVKAEKVKRQTLTRTLRVAGTLEVNETRKVIISAPAASRIDAMAVTYTGMEVQQGQPLITLFSPELVQKGRVLRAAALQQAGSSNDAAQAKSNPFSADLVAPLSGTVIERPVSIGQYVAEGEKLLTIVDASVLWFRFDVYEGQLPWFELGQMIDVAVPAVPEKVFPATITFIEPTVNEATRTVRVRADIQNPLVTVKDHKQRLLRFGMYSEGRTRAEIPDVLAVPRTAILFPGSIAYAYVDRGNGAYEMRRVKLGRQGDELWEVLQGLNEGDRVVTAGNVLIDAQSQFNRGNKPDAGDTNNVADAAGVPPIPEAMDASVTNRRPRTHSEVNAAFAVEKEKLQAMRQSAIADARAQATADPAMPTNAQPPVQTTDEPLTDAMTPNVAAPPDLQANAAVTNQRATTRREAVAAFIVERERLQAMRQAALAEARGQTIADATLLTQNPQISADTNRAQATSTGPSSIVQGQALGAFVTAAAGVSQALAADNLKLFNETMAKLPALVSRTQEALGNTAPVNDLIKSLAEAAKAGPAKDLAEARKQFLPFSTATVELVRQLRKNDPAFTDLKVYHCPMAPQPGLWMQEKGPLANPFYGSQMLTCGEEVK
jgi:RND family efflux transporter MFP subunit